MWPHMLPLSSTPFITGVKTFRNQLQARQLYPTLQKASFHPAKRHLPDAERCLFMLRLVPFRPSVSALSPAPWNHPPPRQLADALPATYKKGPGQQALNTCVRAYISSVKHRRACLAPYSREILLTCGWGY